MNPFFLLPFMSGSQSRGKTTRNSKLYATGKQSMIFPKKLWLFTDNKEKEVVAWPGMLFF